MTQKLINKCLMVIDCLSVDQLLSRCVTLFVVAVLVIALLLPVLLLLCARATLAF